MNARHIRTMISLLVLSIALSACLAPETPGAPATPTISPVVPTPTGGGPPLEPAMIAGRVWHDLCAVSGGEGGAPATPSAGCVPLDGGYQANGVLEPGEPGIAGVVVSLGAGACPAAGLATATTGPDGTYVFNDLNAGTYCVSANPLEEPNTSILIPGGWTAPNEQGALTVPLNAGTQRLDIDFGWDYQFLPAGDEGVTRARLVWHREGGLAGFCDELVIYSGGDAHAFSCAAGELREVGVGLLAGERLTVFRGWVETLQPFTIARSDDATADALTVLLTLYGTGELAATETEIEAIQGFAAQLFTELSSTQGAAVEYVMAQVDLEIRSGPGQDYQSVGPIMAGQTAQVTGKSLDGNWWRVICPDDTVGSCWVPADPAQTQPADPPMGGGPEGGIIATFQVDGEQFRLWTINPQTIEQILALRAGTGTANIPNGRIRRGPGPGGYNLPWSWHLDPQNVEMAEMTIELCDGRPSYVEDNLDEFVEVVERYCPWSAALVSVEDLRAEACPNPPAGQERLVVEEHGYCLHYPDVFEVDRPLPSQVVLLGPVPGAGDRARAFIYVEGAAGRTAAQAADAIVAPFQGPAADFQIDRAETSFAGEPAVVLDGVPGQDLSRQVVVVHGGRLYVLTFVPADEETTEPYTQMESLYAAVRDSFRFLP